MSRIRPLIGLLGATLFSLSSHANTCGGTLSDLSLPTFDQTPVSRVTLATGAVRVSGSVRVVSPEAESYVHSVRAAVAAALKTAPESPQRRTAIAALNQVLGSVPTQVRDEVRVDIAAEVLPLKGVTGFGDPWSDYYASQLRMGEVTGHDAILEFKIYTIEPETLAYIRKFDPTYPEHSFDVRFDGRHILNRHVGPGGSGSHSESGVGIAKASRRSFSEAALGLFSTINLLNAPRPFLLKVHMDPSSQPFEPEIRQILTELVSQGLGIQIQVTDPIELMARISEDMKRRQELVGLLTKPIKTSEDIARAHLIGQELNSSVPGYKEFRP